MAEIERKIAWTTNTIFALLTCGLLAVVLGGCNDGSSSGKPTSVTARIRKAQGQTDPNRQARALLQIADDQIKALDASGAESTLRLTLKACRKIDPPTTRAYVYALLIETHARLDNKWEARRDFQAARQVVEKIDNQESKARALARLGQAQGALTDDVDQAVKTVKEAEKLIGQLDDALATGLTLVVAAEAYGKMGQSEQAQRVIDQILDTALTVPPGRSQVKIITNVASLQHRLKHKEAAKKTFTRAIAMANKLTNVHVKANALADIAPKLSKTGNAQRARQLLEEAEKAATEIPQRDLQQQTLYRIRSLMGKL